MGSDDAAGLDPSDIPEAVFLRVVFHLGHDFFIQTERMDEVQLVVVNCVSLQVVIKKSTTTRLILPRYFFAETNLPSINSIVGFIFRSDAPK